MTTCLGCGASGQPEGARFCFSCGLDLTGSRCPSCEAEVVAGARFCSSCGAVQAGGTTPAVAAFQPVASRRITSVLFGDLVGFTSLSETRDQEDVRELLSSYFEVCRQVIARYGGTVEKFIGDAVMAVWGVPTAHEDDAERAVRAGLELVNAIEAMGTDIGIPELAMRAGIVTGEVAVTVGAEQQGMVAGDAVNTAARVQSAATPGQVWVDETTRLLTTSAISYVDVGTHVMKGKADPVPLWAVRAVVAAVGGAQRADGLEAPHVGRERELRLVKELFHSVEDSGRPAMVIVSGEPGVGKSRLGWEFSKYTDGLTTTCRWHRGRCLSYGEGVAFYALAEAIRGRLQSLRDGPEEFDSDEGQAALLAAGLDEYVDDPAEREWLAPRLAVLLGIGAVATYKREDLFNAWVTFLRRVGDQDPVVLVIDDAQYADEGLVGFLEHLMTVATFPMFVLLMARPSLLEDRPGLATHRRVTVVHLEPLSDQDMEVVLDGLVSGLPRTVRASLVERAEGFPLFAVETVRSLIDRDLVLPRGGQYVLSDPDHLDLETIGAPASLQALMLARLDTLPADQRLVLDRASVIGDSFSKETIAGLCVDVADLDAALGGLVRLQLLRQESDRLSAELGHYQFVQSGVRQVAYATLGRRDRKLTHLAVVDLLEAEDNSAGEISGIIATHLLEALDAVPDDSDRGDLTAAAVGHLRRAATRASSLGAPGEAAAHLQTALDRCDDQEEAAAIRLQLAQELSYSGQHDRSVEHAMLARDHYDAVGDPLTAARATASLARGLMWGPGELDRARALIDERLEALAEVDGAGQIQMALSQVRVATVLRTGSDIRESAEMHARQADRFGDDSDVADSYISLALYYTINGPRGLGRVLLESAAERARTARDHRLLSRALTNLNADWTQDDARRAAEFGRAAVEAARLVGDRRWSSAAVLNLVLALSVAGDWDEALRLLDGDELDTGDAEYADLVRMRLLAARGEILTPPDRTGPDEDLARAAFRVGARARVARAAGAPAGELLIESARLSYQQGGLFDDFTWLWQDLTDVAWESGDRRALDGLFGVVAQDRVNRHPTGLRAQEARMRALLAIQDRSAADTVEAHFEVAMAEATSWQSAPTLARCQADLAVWLTRRGRHEEAEPLLGAAQATYADLGAVAWQRELDLALAAITEHV